jgi:segregation and condensation protein A
LSEPTPFEDDGPRHAPDDAALVLDLEGYGGPIDVLLQLARDQKVDLTRISILALADQYLDFVRQARRLHLELAADYLVMAAWLAYLKSRLLLPEPQGEDEPSGAELAAALRYRLQRLEAMQRAGEGLMARPALGRDVFARGAPEPLPIVTRADYQVSLYDLLTAYGALRGRGQAQSLRIAPSEFYSVDEALHRLGRLIGEIPGWRTLAAFLPPDLHGGLVWRSALASTFAASLEMAREGKLQIRQDGAFGPIYLRGRDPESPE